MNSIVVRVMVAILATLVLGTLMGCETTPSGRHVIVPTNPGERVATPYIGVDPNRFRAVTREVVGPDGRLTIETVMVPITVSEELALRRQAEIERRNRDRAALDHRRQAERERQARAREAERARQAEVRRMQAVSREIQAGSQAASRRLDEAQRRNSNRLRTLQAIRDQRSR